MTICQKRAITILIRVMTILLSLSSTTRADALFTEIGMGGRLGATLDNLTCTFNPEPGLGTKLYTSKRVGLIECTNPNDVALKVGAAVIELMGGVIDIKLENAGGSEFAVVIRDPVSNSEVIGVTTDGEKLKDGEVMDIPAKGKTSLGVYPVVDGEYPPGLYTGGAAIVAWQN
ncbi:hypothetical protein RA335_002109 [Salmonella enterica]|nr:hypothetical protein [Salmonella enterica]